MPERELACTYCGFAFIAFHTAKYCSLKCAVDSRISVRGEDECWPWTGPIFLKDGYGHVSFRDYEGDAHNAAYKVHVGDVPIGHLVRHTCDNPICCNYKAHLLVGTKRDNRQDAVLRNRVCHGVAHHSEKLTPEHVIKIRSLHSSGQSFASLARQFKCSDTSISRIISGRNWNRA